MKIYFEDGKLRNLNQLPSLIDYEVDAKNGISANINFLDELNQEEEDITIYTNSIFAFSNRYAWNENLKVPEIYIRAGEHMVFTRIDKLTTRELREGHNLAKMYVSGEFDNRLNQDFKEDAMGKAWVHTTECGNFIDAKSELGYSYQEVPRLQCPYCKEKYPHSTIYYGCKYCPNCGENINIDR